MSVGARDRDVCWDCGAKVTARLRTRGHYLRSSSVVGGGGQRSNNFLSMGNVDSDGHGYVHGQGLPADGMSGPVARVVGVNEMAGSSIEKRTRSQRTAPDDILRVPLTRSPLKDARAQARARDASQKHSFESSAMNQKRLYAGADSEESSRSDNLEFYRGLQATEGNGVGKSEDTSCDDVRMPSDGEGSRDDNELTHSMGREVTKKRPSPDTQPRFTSPSAVHDRKRVKVEDARKPSQEKEGEHSALEYEVHLRDDDDNASSGKYNRRFVRASSVVSPSKAPFIFPQRCTSVPLDGEDVVPSVDLTAIPPSPRRSPNKRDIEVKRAPSLPPMASDSMEVDEGELRSDGSTHSGDALPNQRKFPAFNYTVNFATPIASKRTIYPLMTPLSPLTPLPPTPFTGRPQKAQSIPQETLHGLEDEMDTDADSLTNIPISPTGATSTLDFSTAKSTASCEPLPRASSRPSSVASSLTSELTSIEDITDLPNLSRELMPPPAVPPLGRQEDTAAGSSPQSGQKSSPPAHSTTTSSSTSKPAISTSVFANRPGGPQKKRSTIAGAMKPRPVSSTSAVPRRVTRSLSVNKTSGDIPQEDGVSRREFNGQIQPYVPRTTAVAPIPSNPTPTAISKHGPAAPQGRPTLSSTLIPPTAGKLKQTSLNTFIRPKSAATTSTTATTASGPAHVSNSTVAAAGPSKLAPLPSPSKIPLPVSPMKHTPGKAKGRAFTSTVSDSNIFAGTSRGAALSTLSHALEKLGVPPPGRPSTSLGFTRLDSANDDGGDGVSDVTQNGGKNKASNEGTVKGKGRANDDMCLPGATSTSMAASGIKRAGFARPTASSLKRSVTLSGLATRTGAGGSSIFPGVRSRDAGSGAGARHGRSTSGMFGRTGERASKNPSLPTVAGSPVKGSNPIGEESGIPTGGKEGGRQEDDDKQADAVESWDERGGGAGLDEGVQILDPSIDMTNASLQNFKADGGPPITSPSSSVDKGKQRTSLASSSLALNPASAALHALSESLSSLPQTPPATKPRVIGTRRGLRSASMAGNKTSPGCGGPGSVPSNSNVVDANETKDAGFSGSIMSENAGGINGSGGAKKSSLKVLKKCAIFVDVRTDQGDDAGSLFVDMLRGLGAKIMGRVCQSCTHIVYKNGLPNTLARYRLLNDPKPFVVGIAWVVECVEQRARMDEEKYKVDVDLIDVAGGNTKRRRSMLPRHLIPLSPANVDSFSLPANMSSEGDEEDVETGDMNESPSRDADTSIRSKDGDDLPPLERARRRRSVLPGGQTRLFA